MAIHTIPIRRLRPRRLPPECAEAERDGAVPAGNIVISGSAGAICRVRRVCVNRDRYCVQGTINRFAAVTAEPMKIDAKLHGPLFPSDIPVAAGTVFRLSDLTDAGTGTDRKPVPEGRKGGAGVHTCCALIT